MKKLARPATPPRRYKDSNQGPKTNDNTNHATINSLGGHLSIREEDELTEWRDKAKVETEKNQQRYLWKMFLSYQECYPFCSSMLFPSGTETYIILPLFLILVDQTIGNIKNLTMNFSLKMCMMRESLHVRRLRLRRKWGKPCLKSKLHQWENNHNIMVELSKILKCFGGIVENTEGN